MSVKAIQRNFVIGDIHGGYKALIQVLQDSRFDYKKDRLLCLGDIADGWPEVRQCIDELFKIQDLIFLMGNHDWWLLQWLKYGTTPDIWISQGGNTSIESYQQLPEEDRIESIQKHQRFLEMAVYYYVDDENRVFVHGGFDWHSSIEDQNPSRGKYSIYTWDRKMIQTAWMWDNQQKKYRDHPEISRLGFKDYHEVFVGHTPTSRMDSSLKPLKLTNLWALDQGAGWNGKLTLMNIDTHEYWQSDQLPELYPDLPGR